MPPAVVGLPRRCLDSTLEIATQQGPALPGRPPNVREIVAVMRHAGDGTQLGALIILLWRAGLRIHEALALSEADLDPRPRIAARQGWAPP